MASEFEMKYRANAALQEKIMADFPGRWQEIAMTTTYYDTPAGELSANHWTLRHRREGEKDICTLKTPAPGGARGEWECFCGEITEALLPLTRQSGCLELLELASHGLIAVCGARFTRQALELKGQEFTAELALDAGLLHSGSREIPLCEVEVELKSGSEDAAVAFARMLAQEYSLQPEYKSKFRRALALAKGE